MKNLVSILAGIVSLLAINLVHADVLIADEQTEQLQQLTSSQNQIININTASLAQLSLLNGIGATKAQAIIEYRESHGAFSSIEELAKVKGVGDKLVEKNRPYIEL